MRLDFPEPETPVTATKSPMGTSTVTCWRLCARALTRRMTRPSALRRLAGMGSVFSPER